MTELQVAALGAAIAWDALWLQFVIIPFFSKDEALHKDYIASGGIDLAISYIESEKLIPVLAAMFEQARTAQEDRRRSPDMNQLLQEVDYLPFLEDVENALKEKKQALDMLSRAQGIARWLWKVGGIHVISMAILPAALLLWKKQLLILASLFVAAMAFVLMLFLLIRFENCLRTFLNILQVNRA